MSDDQVSTGSTGAGQDEPEWKRRRRLAEVFGDAMPEVTSDEKDTDEGSGDRDSAADRWLKSQVPPHHGG